MLTLVFLFWAQAAESRSARVVRIGVVSDGEFILEPLDEILRSEIRDLLEGEFRVEFPESAQVTVGATPETSRDLLEQVLASPEVDMVVALGPVGTAALATIDPLPKPAFGTTVIDRELQGFPITPEGTSGRRNLAYLVDDLSIGEALETFAELAHTERLALLLDRTLADELSEVVVAVGGETESRGVRIRPIAFERPIEATLEKLPEDVDGILLGSLLTFSAAEVETLAAAIAERKLPSFALVSSREVELGMLVTAASSADSRQLGRRVALMIQDTLLGARPEDLPVAREVRREMTLNLATARKIGLPVRFDVMEKAVLIHPGGMPGAVPLSIDAAIERSLAENLDLRSQDRVVAAGREDVWQALSLLLPSASANSVVGWSGGNPNPESRTTSAGLTAQQVLFDESLIGNLTIARYGQEAVEAVREQVRQDLVQATGTAYLEVLRAATALRIQRENLRVTRANLELARTRKRIGTASAGEVYRWESEEANATRDLVLARATDRNARTSFNRVLNVPLEKPYDLDDVTIEQISPIFSARELEPYFEAPALMEHVREYVVARALQFAPELAVVDAQVKAQERLLDTRGRTFYLPRLLATAQADRIFDQDVGAVKGDESRSWSAGVQASIPLAEGGGRVAELRQAREELAQLRIDRRSEAQQVEERVRTAANTAQASFVAIDLTARAAEAGRRTLELVTDAYSRGAVDVLDLLDAQNNALASEQLAANAVYDHAIDLLALQRAGGEFELLETPSQRSNRVERMLEFLSDRTGTFGVGPTPIP
ncbi:MAG: TolC family protein [Myxococcota bacterium]